MKTSKDFRDLFSAVMFDLLDNRLQPDRANAVCNAGGKILKMVEMEYKYGNKPELRECRSLSLASGVEKVGELSN